MSKKSKLKKWWKRVISRDVKDKYNLRRLRTMPTDSPHPIPASQSEPPKSRRLFVVIDRDDDVAAAYEMDDRAAAIKRFTNSFREASYTPYRLVELQFIASLKAANEHKLEVHDDSIEVNNE